MIRKSQRMLISGHGNKPCVDEEASGHYYDTDRPSADLFVRTARNRVAVGPRALRRGGKQSELIMMKQARAGSSGRCSCKWPGRVVVQCPAQVAKPTCGYADLKVVYLTPFQ
jgi:hypothetical protein